MASLSIIIIINNNDQQNHDNVKVGEGRGRELLQLDEEGQVAWIDHDPDDYPDNCHGHDDHPDNHNDHGDHPDDYHGHDNHDDYSFSGAKGLRRSYKTDQW